MKILLTLNKTYRGQPDTGFWYTYKPLKSLGHEVYWYDTVEPKVKNYAAIIEHFKPDLIFCCMTGDREIAPYEPWDIIKRETETGRTNTFNWFCDDTWRFDNFSNRACKYFNVCSTPETNYIEKYKSIGYENILLGIWHANSKYYSPKTFSERTIDIGFIGAPNPARKRFFDEVDVPVNKTFGVSNEDMFATHSDTKIGINLSVNYNDPSSGTQMKQRIFEIVAGSGLLMTEYHEGIEEFFKIDEEIVAFKTPEELREKIKFLSKNEKITEKIALKGHKRFMAEHDSKIRLTNLLEKIQEMR